MSTRTTLASLLLGCSILLLANHDASAANRFPVIKFYSGMGPINFDFVITDSKNQVLCQKAGIKYTVITPTVSCANLLNIKVPENLKIKIAPEANIKCAPASKPIEFSYQPGLDISVVIKAAKNCVVTSQ